MHRNSKEEFLFLDPCDIHYFYVFQYQLYNNRIELNQAYQEGRFIEQAQIETGKSVGAWGGMKAASGIVAFSPIPITKHPVVAIVIVGIGGIAGSVGGESAVRYMQNLNPVSQ